MTIGARSSRTVDVALVVPGTDPRFAVLEPLNVGFLAAYLERHGLTVAVVDEFAGADVQEDLRRLAPRYVGITATTPLAPAAYRAARVARGLGLRTVMGGRHATARPEEAAQHVDIVVTGEGERALLKIVREGIERGVVSEPHLGDVEEIPLPARHLLAMDFYATTRDRLGDSFLDYVPRGTRTAAVFSSRGCPFDCIFCHNSYRDLPYRVHSDEWVLEDLRRLVRNHGTRAVFFIEDNLFVSRKRLLRMCEGIRREGLDLIWGGNARVDNVDDDLLATARSAGCRQVTFGFESGSQRILDVLKKKVKVEQMREAIAACKRNGLLVNGTFMLGNPGETLEDIRETQRFILENPIDSAGVCITTPFPNTELWELCEARGLIPDDLRWKDFTYDHVPIRVCESLTPHELERAYLETVDLVPQNRGRPLRAAVRNLLGNPRQLVAAAGRVLRHPGRLRSMLGRLRP